MMLFLLGSIHLVDIAYLQNTHYIIMARNSSSSSKNAISNIKISDHSLSQRSYRRNFRMKIFISAHLIAYFKILKTFRAIKDVKLKPYSRYIHIYHH